MKKTIKIITSIFIILSILINCCTCSVLNPTLKSTFFAMDTIIEITATGKNAKQALQKARDEVERIDKLLSANDPQSDISKINNGAGELVEVSAETIMLLETAKDLSNKLNGSFDITIYPIVCLWGFNDKDYVLPNLQQIQETLKYVDYSKIEIFENRVKIDKGMSIDLGAIGKGYCSKQVCQLLKQFNITSATINLGGNVQVVGPRNKTEPFKIGIQDPYNQNKILGSISKTDTSVVTSGIYQRNFTQNGKLYHHIFDPNTGYPVDNGLVSVTVICDNPVLADVLSTAFFVLGIDKSTRFLMENKDISAIFVSKDSLYISSALKDIFKIDEDHLNYAVNYID